MCGSVRVAYFCWLLRFVNRGKKQADFDFMVFYFFAEFNKKITALKISKSSPKKASINHVHIMEYLTVTCVKPIRGFLQIYGHKKPELLNQLDSEIDAYQPHTKRIAVQPEIHPNLEFDTIYLALSARSNRYHRCIVREKRPNSRAIIELIDYGSDFEVDTNVVSMNGFPKQSEKNSTETPLR